jgi:UDPglucose 6-dehydrogenase
MAVLYASVGHNVLGVDMDVAVVDAVNLRRYVGPEPGLADLLASLGHPLRLRGHIGYDGVGDTDISFVVVPTPSFPDGRFDPSYVVGVVSKIGNELAYTTRTHTIVVVSTLMPGDMRNAVKPALETSLNQPIEQSNVRLVYSPEFIALGSVIENMRNPNLCLLGGDDPEAMTDVASVMTDLLESDWHSVTHVPPIYRLSYENAEIAKLGLNASVVAKVTMANVLTEICEKFEGGNAVDVLGVIGADPRIGHRYFAPGGPVGGPCFPRDVRALARTLDEDEYLPAFLSSLDSERYWQVDRIVDRIFNSGLTKIGVLGLAYKPGTAVTDEALGTELCKRILNPDVDYEVLAYDPILTSPHAAQHCIGPDICTVVTTDDERWRDLDYTDAGVVIDVWGTLQAKIGEAPFYKRLGVN